MSSAYQKPINIPPEFPAILKAFTREILRAQPANIYEFGARYFAGLQGGETEADLLGRLESAMNAPDRTSASQAKGGIDVEETAVMMDLATATSAELEPILMSKPSQCRWPRPGLGWDGMMWVGVACRAWGLVDRCCLLVPVMVLRSVPLWRYCVWPPTATDHSPVQSIPLRPFGSCCRPMAQGQLYRGARARQWELFIEADRDRSGFLDRQELTSVLRNANLRLSDRQIRQILAEADENDDDVIQYKEFLPIMVDVMQSIKAKEQAKAMMHGVESMVRTEVESMLLHGLPQEELQALMLKVFRKADADGSGTLNRHEFKEALKAAELGLTRKDINLILSHIDVDKDGLVSYEEFIPVCFQVLVERFKDEIVVNDILSNTDELQQMLLTAFRDADSENTGLLTQRQVKAIFKELSYQALGLTTLQTVSLLSQAPTTPDGMVQYIQFVPLAASIIRSMNDVESMKSRMSAIKAVAEAGGIQALGALDLEQLRAVLSDSFQRVDEEGTGQLTLPQVTEVIESLNSLAPEANLALSEQHMKAMFAAIDADESGTVDWTELVNFICDALEHVEREAYIANMGVGAEQGEGGEAVPYVVVLSWWGDDAGRRKTGGWDRLASDCLYGGRGVRARWPF
ncbi:radial spoke protein 7 [Volvox carteri f. nagariensis]|uniref:Radial spoke protein 7 n=1 Tax=Volvox carteri f. nagariensis TaxID=3068 RepID=D8TZ99_VOLCA|nr:radial spoke protein 7 [Volvox carteri f. nagariensis]EFJ47239.1 radial spoke protein 7 [Volvox carteri f. nagariensis]|eukprot:XP_002951788.1 radial spoke protein 7 [Volvox carteri f. nagariensis]